MVSSKDWISVTISGSRISTPFFEAPQEVLGRPLRVGLVEAGYCVCFSLLVNKAPESSCARQQNLSKSASMDMPRVIPTIPPTSPARLHPS